METVQVFKPGLEGVIACETNVSFLDVENEQIVIRGYDLIELAQKVRFVDIISLLLDGKLPDQEQYSHLEQELQNQYDLPETILDVLKLLPADSHSMDALRSGISVLAAFDKGLENLSKKSTREKAINLLAKVPAIVANSYHAKMNQPFVLPKKDLSYSANFLYMITGKMPTENEVKIFDQLLMVYSEHEMPNSTFTARIIASTQSDMYGALTGAVSSLKGNLHGGANEMVMKMILEAKTKDGMEELVLKKLKKKERIMGFGHRVYMKKMDPRAALMKEALLKLSQEKGNTELYDMCVIGEKIMEREKGLYPNLDYYAAPVFYLLNIPIDLYTPIFFASRTAGISAHIHEQNENNRLFRPRVNYLGPRNLHPKSAL
jgi:citrate synthase